MDELNVKHVLVNESQEEDAMLDTTITKDLEREGDIRKIQRAMQELRKEHNLSVEDIVSIQFSGTLVDDEIIDLKKTIRLSDIVLNQKREGKSVELSSGEEFISLL